MIAQVAWLDREFVFSQPIGLFPIVLERLRGTPPRARELVSGIREDTLRRRVHDKWSVKEHLGHLIDLELLDDRRLDEFLNRAEVLSAADMRNRATEDGNHRRIPIADLIRRLAAGRARLLRRFEILTAEEVKITALHPRLQKPMRLLDWAYFLAEHDDHHLALARGVLVELNHQ